MDESPRSDITLVYHTDGGWDVGGGIQSLASLSFSHAADGYTVVTGKEGRKEELKDQGFHSGHCYVDTPER